MGHYGCTAFLLSSGSFHHILNQTGQWPLTTALTLLLTFCNQFKSLVGARLYKARSRAFPNFRWTALDIWISTSEKMNQLLHYFFAICLKKKARHCPSKEVHPWKTPMSPCRMLMSSKCKVKPLNRSLLSGGRISMIMINWSYLLSSLSMVFSSEVHVVRMEVLENRPLQSSTLRYSLEVASKTDIVISNLICFVYFTFSSD